MRSFRISYVLIFLMLASCGRIAEVYEGKEIVLWETYGNEEHDEFVQIVRDFEAAWFAQHGEKIRIRVERLPFQDHVQKLKFAAIAHAAPDIARIDAGELIDLVYGQTILDLRSLDPDVDSYLSTFTAPARETVKIPLRHADNKVREGVYGIPDQITGVAVYYNRKMFRDKGIPFPPASLEELQNATPKWDFARFREVSGKLTDPEAQLYGLALNSSLWFSLPFFNSFGADFVQFTPEGTARCVLNSDSGINALESLSKLVWDKYEAGAWQPGAVNSDDGFANQKYAMIVSGPWKLGELDKIGIDYGVTLVPEGALMRNIQTPKGVFRVGTSTNVGGTDMAILKTARHKEICYAFLKYLTSPEVHAKWCNKLGQIPVQTLAEPLVDFSKNPALAVFMEQIRTAIPRPKIPRYGVLESQIMVPQIERAFKSGNREGVKASLEQAVSEIDRLILNDVNVPR